MAWDQENTGQAVDFRRTGSGMAVEGSHENAVTMTSDGFTIAAGKGNDEFNKNSDTYDFLAMRVE